MTGWYLKDGWMWSTWGWEGTLKVCSNGFGQVWLWHDFIEILNQMMAKRRVTFNFQLWSKIPEVLLASLRFSKWIAHNKQTKGVNNGPASYLFAFCISAGARLNRDEGLTMSGDLWQQLSLPSRFDAGCCFACKVSRSSWKMWFDTVCEEVSSPDEIQLLLLQLLQTYQGLKAMHSKRTLRSQGLSSALISDRCRFSGSAQILSYTDFKSLLLKCGVFEKETWWNTMKYVRIVGGKLLSKNAVTTWCSFIDGLMERPKMGSDFRGNPLEHDPWHTHNPWIAKKLNFLLIYFISPFHTFPPLLATPQNNTMDFL